MRRIKILCVGFLLLAASHGCGIASPPGGQASAYRHAYYLFLVNRPEGCEDCNVPLLITADPLEQAAKAKGPEAGVLILTYERDSIWNSEGIVSFAPRDIEAAPRIIRLRDRRYRYQEIASSEVLKLLENPMGTLAISRPFPDDSLDKG